MACQGNAVLVGDDGEQMAVFLQEVASYEMAVHAGVLPKAPNLAQAEEVYFRNQMPLE